MACDALHGGGGEVGRRRGVVGFLLPDRLALGERLQPRCLAISLRLLRLRARDVGVRRGDLRLILACIDDEQRLTGLDGRAFLEQPLLDDAGHARAHLDVLRALRLPDVFERDGKRLQRHRLHGDVGRREAVKAAALRFLPAGGEEGDEGDG